MPELPEVETVARGLRRLIVGKNIVKVSHDNALKRINKTTAEGVWPYFFVVINCNLGIGACWSDQRNLIILGDLY